MPAIDSARRVAMTKVIGISLRKPPKPADIAGVGFMVDNALRT